jgi:hypothetical protein
MSRTRTTSVKFNGREITSEPLRSIIVVLASLGGLLALMFGIVAMMFGVLLLVLAVCLLPVVLPLDILLKLFGRRGFITIDDGSWSYKLHLAAFRRARY